MDHRRPVDQLQLRLYARRALAAVELAASECGWLADRCPAGYAEKLRELSQGLMRRRADVVPLTLDTPEVKP